MPRKPRFFLPDVPVHMIVRGNSRQVVFAEAEDYHAYLGWLKEGADAHACQIHAYVLMSNHVHLLVSANDPEQSIETAPACGQKIRPLF